MLLGFGWCHLRSSREKLRDCSFEETDSIDELIDEADQKLWSQFRTWMETNADPFLKWQLHDHLNYQEGLLHYCVARNHSTDIWAMLDWIAEFGPGSYGLFYYHNDEDVNDPDRHSYYRVRRTLNGRIEDLDDPFFGPISGDMGPWKCPS